MPCALTLGLFALPVGDIGRLCSVIVAFSRHLFIIFFFKQNISMEFMFDIATKVLWK